ncbi:serine/threonine-protein kinase [Nonomuraea sp. C10]|uniref:serine/threonine-protein kinase n=1 Tax=Nonomuraea sp. C10 TaxID=2600577 RepID=UPI0011CDAC57|nr:serine/threonine-protein kinase [Nonomuraea sp. C10]TXK38360.1 protein kinase [Nonomuraea sp. C10]
MPEQQTHLLAERYELLAPLGRGTMGTVWRARDRALGREVAVKEIRQDSGLTEEQRAELRERMVREGRLAARISHPAVAAIHDVIVHANRPWIIMELVEGRSMEQVIDEEGPLPPRLVAEIGVDLLGALRAAHAQGITHRDVKPGNVLITETGRVVLTDFGIAKAEGDSKLTRTGMVIGSPGYTAPERARGDYTGPESDLWSLGATLYFAVEGRPAYERATIAETLAALLSESADPPTQAGPLRPVLDGLLNKDHQRRLNAAQAETMLRMVADTPTSEMPVITAESLADQEPSLPQAPRPGASPQVGPVPTGAGPVPAGFPGSSGGPSHFGPGPAPGDRPYPQAPAAQTPPSPGAGAPRPAGANPYAGTDPHGRPGPSRSDPHSTGPSGSDPYGTGPSGSDPYGTGPSGSDPYGAGPGGGNPYGAGRDAFSRPPAQERPQDSERTVSMMRPKTPLPQTPSPQGPPPQRGPHSDEGAFTTTRLPRPQPNSPGLQVYPPAPPQQQPGQGPQQMPHPSGPQQMPPRRQQQQQFPPALPPEPDDAPGLGTDLFSIVGPEQRPSNRTGMLVLMGVAAAAAVVIAILVVALLTN